MVVDGPEDLLVGVKYRTRGEHASLEMYQVPALYIAPQRIPRIEAKAGLEMTGPNAIPDTLQPSLLKTVASP